MILVTGATGLVGSHLLYKLIVEGNKVRAIYRRPRKLDNIKHVFSYYSDTAEDLFNAIEWFKADINDVPAMEQAFQNIDYVYHCAAMVSFEPDKFETLKKINIEGTANVVNLCLDFKVKKLCYVSSVAALGTPLNTTDAVDETTPWNKELDHSVYALTKYGAEMEVWRAINEGLDAVIVNPGVILGPGFWHGGSSSGLFKQVYKGLKYYTNGTTGFVGIWDVVLPMLLLMESDVKKERFILVSENLSFKTFFYHTAVALNVRPPAKEATEWMLAIAWRLDWLQFKLTGKRRRLSKHMAKSAVSVSKYSSDKIQHSLKYTFTSVNIVIKEVSALFLEDKKV
jgi:nucleoside-diphosphate-sugar epimerase